MIKYVVKLAPVTKKNHLQIIRPKGMNHPIVRQSEQYLKYEAAAGWFLAPTPKVPIDYPCNVKCLFFMPTHRKVDLTNLLEAIDDVMVKYQVLSDDNSRIIVGHDGSRVLYDKENPRTEVYIERMEDERQARNE